jgi:riboflavin synthase
MFTGIVKTTGTVEALDPRGGEVHLTVVAGDDALGVISPGDSVCVSGACLTAVAPAGRRFHADVSVETLSRTTLGRLAPGGRVNLETAATLTTLLGGHLVSGHVDGTGRLAERHADARSVRMRFEAPPALARYIAGKGSICVEGVSLTVNTIDGAMFDVNIVPHTLAVTTLGDLATGDPVNLEVDQVARYLERLMQGGPATRNRPAEDEPS